MNATQLNNSFDVRGYVYDVLKNFHQEKLNQFDSLMCQEFHSGRNDQVFKISNEKADFLRSIADESTRLSLDFNVRFRVWHSILDLRSFIDMEMGFYKSAFKLLRK